MRLFLHRATIAACLLCVLFANAQLKLAPLPAPLSLNAVTGYRTHSEFLVFSFMGIGAKKQPDDVTANGYVLDLNGNDWSALKPVPGITGRISALAASVKSDVYVIGGYVVDSQNRGFAVTDVSRFQLHANRWLRAPDMLMPVGDAVIGTYDDRYIYVIGGRTNTGPVSDVQVYDAEKEKWSKATPLPGDGVFGHAGALVDDTIILIGGAVKNSAATGQRYVLSSQGWMGRINHKDHTKIQWTRLPDHPGSANFRLAAGGSEKDHMVYFAGGADAMYDLKGIGADGKPVEPSPYLFSFDLRTGKWDTISDKLASPVMDQSTLVVTTEGLVVVGGMTKGQEVTPQVTVLPKITHPAK
ncbi:MAG TPA: kelch repeat-containing protein [Terriglobales bacterium]